MHGRSASGAHRDAPETTSFRRLVLLPRQAEPERPRTEAQEKGRAPFTNRFLGAVILTNGVGGCVGYRRGDDRRPGSSLGGLLPLMLLFLQPDFLFEGAFQLVGSPFEFSDALAEGTPQLRQFSGSKNDQSDHENDDQLWHANRTKHNFPTFKRTRG